MRTTRALVVIGLLVAGSGAAAMQFTDWAASASLESMAGTDPALNTAFQDGCPAPSKDGLSIYMASNRPGGYGGLDLWVAYRDSADDPFGAPVNLGSAINTAADEFCPTPLTNGQALLFVSTPAGGCGLGDIYLTREHVKNGWETPENLGCGVNSAGEEASPFIVADENGGSLYFSSTRAGGFSADTPGAVTGDADLRSGDRCRL